MEYYTGIVDMCQTTGMRLDRYASECLKLLSRSQIKNRTEKSRPDKYAIEAKVNGKAAKFSKQVKQGDRIEISWQNREEENLEGEDIPLDILYEDTRVVVVNKPPGMIVHPGAGNYRGTLANALLYRKTSLVRGPGGESAGLRAGIVHRLDKDTSGVIIAAWDEQALDFLASQFRERSVKKRYAAIVHGIPQNEGFIDSNIVRDPKDRKRFTVASSGGKPARTRYRLIRSWGEYSLLLVSPATGRTHQIRVHLKSIGHPVAGDPIYGNEKAALPGLMLHAWSLEIVLPGHGETSVFRAPLPSRFRAFMDAQRFNEPGL